jgi:inactivated superfamily I helicase
LLIVDDNAALDIALVHALKDPVDVVELVGLDRGLDLTLTSEIERFLEVDSRAVMRLCTAEPYCPTKRRLSRFGS